MFRFGLYTTSAKQVVAFSRRFKKRTGNEQGTSVVMTTFLHRLSGSGLVLALVVTGSFAANEKMQDTYKADCQGCHGPSGRASIVGKKLGARDFQDPAVAKMSSLELTKVIAKGRHKMPSYEGRLTPEQIRDLAKYIRELK